MFVSEGGAARGRFVAFRASGLVTLNKVRNRILIAILAAGALALGAATIASGIVPIYENNFASGAKVREIKKLSGGAACSKLHEDKRFVALVKGGPTKCIFRTPVVGDGSGPDHQVAATARVDKATSSKIRKQVYVGVGARAAKKTGFELRVFPKRGRWEVHRSPTGTGFPVKGSSEDINGVGKANEFRLTVFGNTVAAHINGTKVMSRTDSNAAQVSGVNTTLVAAGEKKTQKTAKITFDSFRVRLPNP